MGIYDGLMFPESISWQISLFEGHRETLRRVHLELRVQDMTWSRVEAAIVKTPRSKSIKQADLCPLAAAERRFTSLVMTT